MLSPSSPGSAYVLFHHIMGETDGVKGIWSYVQGGMGSITQAIARSATDLGASIHTNCPVAQIINEGDKVTGVKLEDGTIINAKNVLSNATPEITFRKLIPKEALPEEFLKHIKHFDYNSSVVKINVAIDRLPNFTAYPNKGENTVGPPHMGTIHLEEKIQDLEDAYHDALAGEPSKRPVIEMTIPTSVDTTISPEGKHVCMFFVQYAPYKLKNGSWDDPGRKEAFADRVFNVVEEFAPGFKSSVVGRDILSPLDLERVFGLTGGNIFHGAMGLNQLYFMRPAPGYSDYRSPLKGLYLCGSGSHPGGGVMGAPGRNCANVVIKDHHE